MYMLYSGADLESLHQAYERMVLVLEIEKSLSPYLDSGFQVAAEYPGIMQRS